MEGINLIIIKGDQGYDVTQLVEKIVWKGRKGSSSRTLAVTLIDDDGYKHARSEIDVEKGHQCIFCYDGEEYFRGIIMAQSQNVKRKKLTFTAYDNGIYLANNKDTFVYENKTASDIFRDCCNRYNIPMGEVTECSYKIPELTKPKTSPFDTIADALSLDFDATGIRHYVSSNKGKLSLLTRRENILQWVIEVGQNLIDATYSRSIEDIKTRVKLISSEGTTLAEKGKPELEKVIGIFQEIEEPEENLTEAQLNDLISSILDEKSTPERSLSLEAIGVMEVISGFGVFVIIPELDLSRTFYVDSDTHTFEDNKHTMTLTLNYASDISNDQEEDTDGQEYNVGDIVQFKGGCHYISSVANSPASKNLSPGPARIAYIAKGAKHPYSLITEDWATTHVWGWVDEGTFS